LSDVLKGRSGKGRRPCKQGNNPPWTFGDREGWLGAATLPTFRKDIKKRRDTYSIRGEKKGGFGGRRKSVEGPQRGGTYKCILRNGGPKACGIREGRTWVWGGGGGRIDSQEEGGRKHRLRKKKH